MATSSGSSPKDTCHVAVRQGPSHLVALMAEPAVVRLRRAFNCFVGEYVAAHDIRRWAWCAEVCVSMLQETWGLLRAFGLGRGEERCVLKLYSGPQGRSNVISRVHATFTGLCCAVGQHPARVVCEQISSEDASAEGMMSVEYLPILPRIIGQHDRVATALTLQAHGAKAGE